MSRVDELSEDLARAARILELAADEPELERARRVLADLRARRGDAVAARRLPQLQRLLEWIAAHEPALAERGLVWESPDGLRLERQLLERLAAELKAT